MRLIDADKLLENSFKNPISYNAFCNLVKRQMPVDAVPVRHGHWIGRSVIGGIPKCECSECETELLIWSRYCPNCGARMYGKGDDNE